MSTSGFLQALLEKVRIFVKEMAAGGPAASRSQGGASNPQPARPKIDLASAQQPKADAKQVERAKQHKGGKRTFEATEKFYARAKDIYACFTDARCISAYTQSPSKVRQGVAPPACFKTPLNPWHALRKACSVCFLQPVKSNKQDQDPEKDL